MKEPKDIKPLSEKETLRLMIIEEQNKLMKCKVDNRLYARYKTSNSPPKLFNKMGQPVVLDLVIGQNQKNIEEIKKVLLEMISLYKEADDVQPLAKELGSVIVNT